MKKSFKMLLLKPLNHLKTNYAGMFLGWLNYLSFPRIRCSPISIHVDSLQLNTCFYLCSLLDYQPVEQVNMLSMGHRYLNIFVPLTAMSHV